MLPVSNESDFHDIPYALFISRVSVYLILFGLTVAPFFELVNWSSEAQIPPLHACSSNPGDIRKEVENLKTSFNMRMKQILFNSILNAYYAGFIPCCFAQVNPQK